MKTVSIAVISFNGADDLPACLDSIRAQDYGPIELVLIDNASTDGSRCILREFAADPGARERFAPGLRVIENEANTGFSPALNQGIAASTGELVMPMNTDVVLEMSFVSELVGALEQPGAGSATGKLIRFPPGGEDNVIDTVGHVLFSNRLAQNIGEGFPAEASFNEPGRVFGTCGAAALYSREMLEDIAIDGEIFDEDFFAFWEDLDVDWRANLRGWKCFYEPKAIGWHKRGGAGYRKSLTVEYHNYKNRYLMIMKNDTAARLLRNLPGILVTEVLKGGALLVRCRRALLSLGEVARLTPKMMRKRRAIQSRRIVPPSEIERMIEPFDYGAWIRRHLLNRGEMIVRAEAGVR